VHLGLLPEATGPAPQPDQPVPVGSEILLTFTSGRWLRSIQWGTAALTCSWAPTGAGRPTNSDSRTRSS